MQKIFFVELVDYTEEDEEDEENDENKENDAKNDSKNDAKNDAKNDEKETPNDRLFGNKTIEERNEQNLKQISYMKENYGHIFRSKGFLWMAGRDDQYAEWSQAGTIGKLEFHSVEKREIYSEIFFFVKSKVDLTEDKSQNMTENLSV